ncbi:MAG TPA: ankyrin repeat domain-containing protein [Polyangiaceae bacterium]|nr:ankyrin repeat domain-containing protein [Polyangiaceae bacterium]
MAQPKPEAKSSADIELLEAARRGDVAATRSALARGADVEARDASSRTALTLAVTSDFVDVARVLVEHGASPNALDAKHDTPWLVTGETGSVAMVEALLPGKPDFAIVNRFGGISVIPASERGHVDYVRRVVKLPINVNHVNNLGWTALLECVLLGDGSEKYRQIAQILKDAGADVRIRDRDGVDAVEHARRKGYHEIVNILSS